MQSSTYCPVIVEVAELIGESLNVIWFESRCVPDDIEVGWSDSPLTDALAHQEEVIPAQTQ